MGTIQAPPGVNIPAVLRTTSSLGRGTNRPTRGLQPSLALALIDAVL